MAQLKKIKKAEIEENEADVKIDEFCARLGLEALHAGGKESIHFSTFNINRPGLQFAGFFEHFSAERVQVVGEQEMAYLKTLSDEARMNACEALFKHDFPCLVVSTVLEPVRELMLCAEKYNRVVLRSKLRTTMIMNELSIFLNELLAPTQTIHGVLMDLYGVGILIIGNSSIGKSETALELIQRNHRLIADDAVVIKRISDRLVGASPPVIRYFMEVRGIGIIDIRSMYGAGAVKLTKVIDMVVRLEEWDVTKEYDRLGNVKEAYNIFDVELPMHTVPVKPGRNLAVILEVAARNYRLKSMGYDTLTELEHRLGDNKTQDDPFDY
ncbi:MAG: HPr(Ser) kinase/phosphatase [Clostridiales bacterium]|jgi:HPr kinase/phosphorylase|nr:HPr(Ser) kinase/phosphatase [Clostridiales bacterium]